MAREPVLDRIRAVAKGLAIDATPLGPGLAALAVPAQVHGAAVAIRHDRARIAVRVGLAGPTEQALAPALVELLAKSTRAIAGLAVRARNAPAAVELDCAPPQTPGLAIHLPGAPLSVVLDELLALGMPAGEATRARAVFALVERTSADAVIWRVRPPSLLTCQVAFAVTPDGDAMAWAAGAARALSMVLQIEADGRALIKQLLDAGLPSGRPVLSLTASLDGLLPRIGFDIDDVTMRDAAAVLARIPGGEPAVPAAAALPLLGAEPTGSLSLALGDSPFGALVTAVMP